MQLTICDRNHSDTSGKFLVDSGSIKIFGNGLPLFVLTLNQDGSVTVSAGAADVPLNGVILDHVLAVTPGASNRVTIARKPYVAPSRLHVGRVELAADRKHPDYITVQHGMAGYFAVLMKWCPAGGPDGGFYEPYETGNVRSPDRGHAEQEAHEWAEAEGVEVRP